MKHKALLACLTLISSGCSETGLLVEVTIDQSQPSLDAFPEIDTLAFVVVADRGGSMQTQPLDLADVHNRDLRLHPYNYLLRSGPFAGQGVLVAALGMRAGEVVAHGALDSMLEFRQRKVLHYRIGLLAGPPERYGDCITIAGVTFAVDGQTPCTPRPAIAPVAVSCTQLKSQGGLTGVQTIDGLGSVFCDQTTDGGGWTLVASYVDSDGVSSWSTLAPFIDDSTFGSQDHSQVADYKNPGFFRITAHDLLVRTNDYEFAFHGVLAGETLGHYIGDSWPLSCAHTWIHSGVDYALKLTDPQKLSIGFILRGGNPDSSQCFTTDANAAAVGFMTSEHGLHGVGVTPSEDQPLSDLNLAQGSTLLVKSCSGDYPCNDLKMRGDGTCTDISCMQSWAKIYVR
jgi:hypothetical protein